MYASQTFDCGLKMAVSKVVCRTVAEVREKQGKKACSKG